MEQVTLPDAIQSHIVDVKHLDEAMLLIEPGLSITQEKTKANWNSYHVYFELKIESSKLVMVTEQMPDGRKPVGFFIFTETPDSIFIWVAYSSSQSNIVEIAMDQIMTLAKNLGKSSIQFGSPRRGWEKAAAKLGFEVEEVRYKKYVQ